MNLQPQTFKYEIVFSKTGLVRYISHLDLMRLFQRSLRRTGFKIAYTQGFNPHPKMSFKRALRLGEESLKEQAVIYLAEQIDAPLLRKKLQTVLPHDIEIKQIFEAN